VDISEPTDAAAAIATVVTKAPLPKLDPKDFFISGKSNQVIYRLPGFGAPFLCCCLLMRVLMWRGFSQICAGPAVTDRKLLKL
jgi:hypothetical protein